jgi:hypothetical protein
MDVHQLLRMKEDQLAQVRAEIDALRVVAPLLLDSDEAEGLEPDDDQGATRPLLDNEIVMEHRAQEEVSTETDDVSQAIPPRRSRLRSILGLAAGE